MNKADAATTGVAPVVKTRTVPLEPAAAFDLFTRRMGQWWPTTSHSIAGDRVTGVVFEEEVGGRVWEVTDEGERHAWAEVTAWDPPRRFALSWHPSLDPVTSTDLEVTFAAAETGTDVRLVHRGWETFGDQAAALRDDYEGGWDVVLAPYEAAAEA